MINDDIAIDPPSVRMSIITSNAQTEARKWTETFSAAMQPHVEEPYRKAKHYEKVLSDLRSKAEPAVLKKYDVYEDESKLYDAIVSAVAEVFNQVVSGVTDKVKARQLVINNHAQSMYKTASSQLSTAEAALPTKLTGDADEVDSTLLDLLKGVLQQYHAALNGWILPEKTATDNLNELKTSSLSVWSTGHHINSAKHISRQHTLRGQALAPVEFFFPNKVTTECANTEESVRDLMAEKYPDFFSDKALRNTISIDANFSSQKPGSGRLILHGENMEYLICQDEDKGRKGHGASLTFNPVSKELHATIWGWGHGTGKLFQGNGNCNNGNSMDGVGFTVITNALFAAPKHYDAPYVEGETPAL